MAVARGEVGAVAREWGLDGEALEGVRLAVSEAASNAVLHGSSGRKDAHVGVTVELTELEMRVAVSDSGSVEADVESAGLGAGLWIIAAVTSRFDIRSAASGTDVHMFFRRSDQALTDTVGRQRRDTASREHQDAILHLDAALAEQDRLAELLDEAVGTSTEFRAYLHLQAVGERVAAWQDRVSWIGNALAEGSA